MPRISIAIGIDVDTGKLTDRRAMDTRPSRGADAGLDRGQQACTIGDFSETADGSAIATAAGTVTAQQAVAKPDHRAIVDAAVGEHGTLEIVPEALGENAVVVGAAFAAIRRI